MPVLDPIGVRAPEDINLEPLTIPIVGYTEDKKEVVTDVRFQPIAPLGFALDMLRSIDGSGNISQSAAIIYVDKCVMPDDKEAWELLLKRPGIYIYPETIVSVYEALGEFYSARPSKRRSGSPGGRSSTKPTSQAAVSSRVSTKKASR